MNTPNVQLRSPKTARLSPAFGKSLGQVLVDEAVLDNNTLLHALRLSRQLDVPLAQVLLAEGWVDAQQVASAEAKRFAAIPVSMQTAPSDPACLADIDPVYCLKHGLVPWMRLGGTLVVATARPASFAQDVRLAGLDPSEVICAVTTPGDIEAAIAQSHGPALVSAAETSVPEDLSSRNMHVLSQPKHMRRAGLLALCVAAVVWLQPALLFAAVAGWAVISLVAIACMKLVALAASLRAPEKNISKTPQTPQHVTLMVPLFDEKDIAGALIKRLERLRYPKTHLEALLILEAEDQTTRATLAQTDLPGWMRVITVPPGSVKTKPRALNYALNFARGDIVGIYDAEDDPVPDQIDTIVAHFAAVGPEVGCLQGILDYYNPRMNWLARCFTIEYAAWFRVLLPGLSRVGMPIPLGGTTVFFRRHVLEEMRGWDAHNVTEDADLGMRLARAGYRTELADTVTLEEANCRFWPWVRQRSRWLKGYVLTYLAHMRSPRRLWRDLGPGRFLGFQVFFLCALSQFALAPLLWSFWAVPLGLSHPLVATLPEGGMLALAGLFLVTEAIGLSLGIVAVSSPRHRHLTPWVPTMLFYFPLAAIAMYKALWECLTKPFYWDKTSHGHALGRAKIAHETP